MLRLTRFGVVVAAMFAVGCATLRVSAHRDREMNFTQFVAFDWGAADTLPTGDPRLDNNPFFRDYLTGAVERQLAAHGYRLAPPDTAPQLLVHFHANVSQRFEVHGMEPSNYPNCYPNCEPAVAEYEDGTIVIDIVDAATDRLVWRGWAQDDVRGLIDHQDRLQAQIDRMVEEMFEQFPRGGAPPLALPAK